MSRWCQVLRAHPPGEQLRTAGFLEAAAEAAGASSTWAHTPSSEDESCADCETGRAMPGGTAPMLGSDTWQERADTARGARCA